MDFGKLQNIQKVDFSLPPDDPGSAKLLGRLSAPPGPPGIYVACPVWNHPGFVGLIYPPGTDPREQLRLYARHFNSIELNTTYYGVNRANLSRWRSMVAEDFRFVPKLTRHISHDRRLDGTDAASAENNQSLREDLGATLGPAFLLLPGDFAPAELRRLESFLDAVPSDLQVAEEFRHPDWFSDRRVFDLLEERAAIAVITDTAGRRDVVHQRLTSNTLMVRFVGNSLDPSDFKRLEAWVEKLADWTARGLRTVYFCLHQPDESHNVELARFLIQRLNERLGLALRPPEPLARQQELF